MIIFREACKCWVCGYEWLPKIKGRWPHRCAKCDSYRWNFDRVI
jgi:predicted Zn-ribbon and HTH transcriptional regulator